MKKLMIAAAIVCAAAMSQAATCYWNVKTTGSPSPKYIYEAGSTTAKYSGDVYIFQNVGTINQDAILTAFLNNDSLDSLVNVYTDAGLTKKTDPLEAASGKINTTTVTTLGTGEEGAATGTANFFLAIVDDGKLFLSANQSGKESGLESGTALTFNVQSASQQAAFDAGSVFGGDGGKGAGWYQAVPEPTSGLLLLLGVAGLALRRRRA